MNEYQKEFFINILSKKADTVEFSKSLSEISHYMNLYYKSKAVILIDEYDVPIQGGFLNNY